MITFDTATAAYWALSRDLYTWVSGPYVSELAIRMAANTKRAIHEIALASDVTPRFYLEIPRERALVRRQP